MKTGIIAIFLCIFFFLVPLHVYIMGNNLGIGIQGAVYRYQITGQGNSLITFPNDLSYVTSGIYKGKTAYSIIFWITGTLILMVLTIFSLIRFDLLTTNNIKMISAGVIGAGIGYLVSCIFQYGLFFSGAAGISLPVGVIFMMMSAMGLFYYRDFFSGFSQDQAL
jgi:hypothetical protein